MIIRPTWRILYVLVLLSIISWQAVRIHNLQLERAALKESLSNYQENHRENQITIQELLIALGAMKP